MRALDHLTVVELRDVAARARELLLSSSADLTDARISIDVSLPSSDASSAPEGRELQAA